MKEKVFVTGATGFVGRALVPILAASHYEVQALTRREYVHLSVLSRKWDHRSTIDLSQADYLVHLAGEPIFGRRWTQRQKAALYDSRILSTRALVESMAKSAKMPKAFVCASAIGYYGDTEDLEISESSPQGGDFLAKLCGDWEAEAQKANAFGVRTVSLRFGIILGRGGGAISKMLLPFKLGLGGRIGSGKQWMSWVHIDDVCGLILHALRNASLQGPLNATAPQPITNRQFTRVLARVLKRPAIFPVPRIGLKLAMGDVAEVLIKGQKVLPQKALQSGFQFKHTDLEEALRSVVR